MNTPNIISVKLKLERNKLTYNYSDETKTLEIGSTGNLSSMMIIQILLPISVGLLLIAYGFFKNIGGLEPIGSIFCLYGSYAITLIKKRKRNNKNSKIINPGSITITKDQNKIVIKSEEIDAIESSIELVTKDTYEGVLSLTTNGQRHILLSLNEMDEKLLQEDLNYIRDYILTLIKMPIPGTQTSTQNLTSNER